MTIRILAICLGLALLIAGALALMLPAKAPGGIFSMTKPGDTFPLAKRGEPPGGNLTFGSDKLTFGSDYLIF